MDEDAARLGIEKPDAEPRATQYVQGMLDMIETLRGHGLAYEATNVGRSSFSRARKSPGRRYSRQPRVRWVSFDRRAAAGCALVDDGSDSLEQ
jgi:cysteinyl-tRNA synthetase